MGGNGVISDNKTAYTIAKPLFDAVIFDLDGVVTDTATEK